MTLEEVKGILSNNSIAIQSVNDIPHGKAIRLESGQIINCYDSGKHVVQGKHPEEIKRLLESTAIISGRRVFVVYGHDDMARTQLEALLRRWDLEPIILDQLASAGSTIIEKLEDYSSNVAFAIVLATPDDIGKAKDESEFKSRVRQNVVLELGMLLAKLGRKKVAILLKEDPEFEKPSDIQGLIYIPFSGSIEDAALNLIRELSRQGITIDTMRI